MHWSVTKRSQKALGGVGVGVGGKVKDAQHVSPASRLSTAVNETHNAHALRAPKHEGRYRNGRRRGRHSLLLHRPLIGGWRGVRCPRCRNENFACEAGRAPDVVTFHSPFGRAMRLGLPHTVLKRGTGFFHRQAKPVEHLRQHRDYTQQQLRTRCLEQVLSGLSSVNGLFNMPSADTHEMYVYALRCTHVCTPACSCCSV